MRTLFYMSVTAIALEDIAASALLLGYAASLQSYSSATNYYLSVSRKNSLLRPLRRRRSFFWNWEQVSPDELPVDEMRRDDSAGLANADPASIYQVEFHEDAGADVTTLLRRLTTRFLGWVWVPGTGVFDRDGLDRLSLQAS